MQDNVALIAVLEASEAPGKAANRERRQLVCVANTHVHSNPELTDVKLWQVRQKMFICYWIGGVQYWAPKCCLLLFKILMRCCVPWKGG